MTTTEQPTIVLVHGAWADTSSWDGVRQELETAGHPVLVAANPLRGLRSDADALSAFLAQRTDGQVVLVGHSYGGAVITNAALSTPRVKALVYVDAFMLDEGESLGQIVGSSTSSLNVPDPTNVYDVVGLPDSSAEAYLKPAVVQHDLAQDLPEVAQRTVIADQRPIALAAVGEPSGIPAWKTIPAHSVIGTQDKVLPEAVQLEQAQRANATVTKVDGSHMSLISHAAEVAEAIAAATR